MSESATASAPMLTMGGFRGSNQNLIDPFCYRMVLSAATGVVLEEGWALTRFNLANSEVRAKEALAALLTTNEHQHMPAAVHPAAHGLHYATGVFGGIRATCIEGDDGANKLGVFLPDLHAQRFLDHMVEMALVPEDHALTTERMVELFVQLARLNHVPGRQLYIRPIAFNSDCRLGVGSTGLVEVLIITRECTQYIAGDQRDLWYPGERAIRADLRPGGMQLKESGEYGASFTLKMEAKQLGEEGEHIVEVLRGAETTGSCIFWVQEGGDLFTFEAGEATLDSFTHRLAVRLLQHRGHYINYESPLLYDHSSELDSLAQYIITEAEGIALVGTWTGAVMITGCLEGADKETLQRRGGKLLEGGHPILLQLQQDVGDVINGRTVANDDGEVWSPPQDWGRLHAPVCDF